MSQSGSSSAENGGGENGRTAAGRVRIGGGSVALPAIEKLRGRENYTTWAFAMRMILIREGCWEAVSAEDQAQVPEDVKQRALATICLSLETYNYSLVLDATDAKIAWKKLESAFQDSGLTRKIGLLRKFTSIRLVNSPSVEAYVDELMSTSHKLSSVGFKVDDSWLAAMLLMGLPDQYEPMIMGLEASGIALTADAVKAKILQDVKIERGATSCSDEGALYSKHGAKKWKSSTAKPIEKPTAKSDEKTCFNCKKPGHFAAKCPEKQEKLKPSKHKGLCSVFAMGDVSTNEWYFDSGATCHMARSDQKFVGEVRMSHDVGTANNSSMKAVARGSVELDSNEGRIDVSGVLKIPDLATNLLSVSTICKKGKTVIFTKEKCEVWDEDGDLVITGVEEGGLYRVNRPEKSFLAGGIELWHRRLGHLHESGLKKLKRIANGIDFQDGSLPNCVACLEGKHARRSFPSSESRAEDLLELVHSDLCGPVEVPSLGGSRYFMTFLDDASKRVAVYFLKTKNQALEAFKSFKAKAEREKGRKLKILRSDNGKEYVNADFRKVLESDGIRHQTTCPYTPEQNGAAERMNRTLVEKARCMLNDAKLGKEFWAEAISTAAHVVNRCPTRSLEDKTPEEAWTGKKPNLGHLKIFGSNVMTQVPKVRRKKFDPKSEKGIFVGYCEDTKGYRVYDPLNNRFHVSRDVVVLDEGVVIRAAEQRVEPVEFMELCWDEFLDDSATGAADDPEGEEMDDNMPGATGPAGQFGGDGDPDDTEPADEAIEVSSSSSEASDFEDACAEFALPPQLNRPADEMQQGLRRSGRERRPPGKYSDFISYSSISGGVHSPQLPSNTTSDDDMAGDPTSYEEAMRRPDRDLWIAAMREEIASLNENSTWVLADLPEGRKAIRNKWVFRTKKGPDGTIQRYKARLVVKGCSQRPGLDYNEVYSPVVRYATVRYLMALAVRYNLDIDQMDAVTAFLQGELKDEEIYMLQPEGFAAPNGKVCRLKKALYGLKQSSRVWNAQLDEVLREFGLKRSSVDPCMYWCIRGEKVMFVTIYVDDLLIFTNDRKHKKKLKAHLQKRFQMKDLGEAKHCLGVRITRNREEGKLWLDQQAYIEDIIERFGMADAHPVATPADPSIRLDKSMAPKTKSETEEMKSVPYKEAVGCLSFAAQVTRPDISFAVNVVSQYSANPGRPHWEAVKRIIRYLKGTLTKKLEYSTDDPAEIVGYSDADWGGDIDDRKSTTGYVFVMQGGAISWNVKKQPTVALSSCEAEYMAMSRTIQEAMWWSNLQSPFFEATPISVRCDNQSAISIANNGSYSPRTKHVSIRYHFVHASLQDGVVKLSYTPTTEQPADGFTKPMTVQKQQKFRQLIGVAD